MDMLNRIYIQMCEDLLNYLRARGITHSDLCKQIILARTRFRFNKLDDELLTLFWKCHDETYRL